MFCYGHHEIPKLNIHIFIVLILNIFFLLENYFLLRLISLNLIIKYTIKPLLSIKKSFKNTKGVIRSRKSKTIQLPK